MTFRPPQYMQNSDLFSYSAADDRFIIDTLFSEGLLAVAAGQGLAAQRPDGANMSVFVPPFDAIIDGDDAALQGAYLLRMVVAEYATVTGAPASGSRIDLLVVEIVDSTYRTITAANPEGPRLRVIAGTPAASNPAVPAVPATAIPLAQITVAAGQTSIVAANITDRRTQSGAAGFSPVFPSMTTTQRNAITSPTVGQAIFNTTTGKQETYAGSTLGWVAGAAVNVQTFTASGTWTKPANAAFVFVLAWGGGGGGGANTTSPGATGGSGGEGRRAILPAAALGATEQVIVGAGGATATSVGNPGNRSSFGAHVAALPGAGGIRTNSITPGGGSYIVSSALVDNPESGGTSPNLNTLPGGGAQYGGGAGGQWVSGNSTAYAGGTSGAAGIDAPNAIIGRGAYGGGGTAGTSSTSGGDGISRSGTGRGGDGGGGGATGGAGGIPGGGGGGGINSGGPGGRGEVIVITLSA